MIHVVASNAPLPSERAYGGALSDLAGALQARGDSVSLAAPVSAGEQSEAVVAFDLGGSSWKALRRLQRSRRLAVPATQGIRYLTAVRLGRSGLLSGADLLWSRDPEMLLTVPKASNVFGILELHHLPSRLQSWHLQEAVRRSRGRMLVVAIATEIAEAVERLVAGRVPVLIEPSGVNDSFFHDPRPIVPGREVRLVYVGSFTSHGVSRGCDLFVRLAKSLNDRLIPFRLVIAGGTAAEITSLVALRDDLGLPDQAVRIEGRLSRENVSDLIAWGDVLLANYPERLTDFHRSPLKLVEYAASGRPILASTTTSVVGTLPDGTFIGYREADIDSLVNAFFAVYECDELRAQTSNAARSWALGHTWKARTERVVAAALEQGRS